MSYIVISTTTHSIYLLLQLRNIPRERWTPDGQPVVQRPKRTSTPGIDECGPERPLGTEITTRTQIPYLRIRIGIGQLTALNATFLIHRSNPPTSRSPPDSLESQGFRRL